MAYSQWSDEETFWEDMVCALWAPDDRRPIEVYRDRKQARGELSSKKSTETDSTVDAPTA